MRLFLALCMMCLAGSLVAQYKVSEIPEHLKEDVNAVVRYEEGLFRIESRDQSSFQYKKVVTILNGKAKRLAEVVLGYDKSSKVKFNKANVYDANGKLIYKLKKSDIVDQSSSDGFSVYQDNRIKYLDLTQRSYPYTVEYEYEEEYDFVYVIPRWSIFPRSNVSVQKSVYRVVGPMSLRPRYKNLNLKPENFEDKSTADWSDLNWKFEDMKAIEAEPYGPTWREFAPMVYLSPTLFEYGGYQGDLSTWDGLAKWQSSLNQGRDALPASTISEVQKLVAGLKTDREKIKAVYEYLQGKTRYVSIQLGIGGLQPFPAMEVDELGYGDCKALSNYTRSMLKAVGIESLYTKVDAGEYPRPLDPEFAIPSFNHIILCVPNKGDTVWLECTSQTKPFDYMGKFTGDRDVLLVTDDGGKIVHTPVYDHTVNIQSRTVQIALAENGEATAQVATSYQGLEYEEDGLDFVLNQGDSEQKEWVLDHAGFANVNLTDYSMSKVNRPVPEAIVEAGYDLGKYAKASGKRMFFALNPLSRVKYIPPKVEDRKTVFWQEDTFTERDSVVFTFPERFNFEYLPEGQEFSSEFGEYKSEVIREEGKLIYKREFVLWKKRYAPEAYEAFRDFMKKVVRADDIKAVLNKNT